MDDFLADAGRADCADEKGIRITDGVIDSSQYGISVDGVMVEIGVVVEKTEQLPCGFGTIDSFNQPGGFTAEAAGADDEQLF